MSDKILVDRSVIEAVSKTLKHAIDEIEEIRADMRRERSQRLKHET